MKQCNYFKNMLVTCFYQLFFGYPFPSVYWIPVFNLSQQLRECMCEKDPMRGIKLHDHHQTVSYQNEILATFLTLIYVYVPALLAPLLLILKFFSSYIVSSVSSFGPTFPLCTNSNSPQLAPRQSPSHCTFSDWKVQWIY